MKKFAVMAAGLSAAVLAGSLMTSASAQTIKIGVTEPLTGPFAASGNYVTKAPRSRRTRSTRPAACSARRSSWSSKTTRATRPKRVGRREADRPRQGAGDDGRLGLQPDARRHAEARGIQGADAGRDLVVRQDHHLRQSLHLPHQPDLGDGGQVPSPRSWTSSTSRRPTSWSSTTTGASARRKSSARCSRSNGITVGLIETMDPKARTCPPSSPRSRPRGRYAVRDHARSSSLRSCSSRQGAAGLDRSRSSPRRVAIARSADRSGRCCRQRHVIICSSSRPGSPRCRRIRKRQEVRRGVEETGFHFAGLTEGFRGYDGIMTIVAAIKKAGKADPEAIRAALWERQDQRPQRRHRLHQAGPDGKESAQNMPSVYLVKIEGGKVVVPQG